MTTSPTETKLSVPFTDRLAAAAPFMLALAVLMFVAMGVALVFFSAQTLAMGLFAGGIGSVLIALFFDYFSGRELR